MTIDEMTRLHTAADAARAAMRRGRTRETEDAFYTATDALDAATWPLRTATEAWLTTRDSATWLALVAAWQTLKEDATP